MFALWHSSVPVLALFGRITLSTQPYLVRFPISKASVTQGQTSSLHAWLCSISIYLRFVDDASLKWVPFSIT
jgi:hypothetical protein